MLNSRRMQVRRMAWRFWYAHAGEFLTEAGPCGVNPDGAQCINPPLLFCGLFGVAGPCGDASAWVAAGIEGMTWHANRRGLRLHAGDIAVFNPAIVGAQGHVAIVLDGSREPFASADQNWPLGAPLNFEHHLISGLAGVQRLI